mmetsp:Transcript_6420/g.15867  ORF Transcript_6420/g.15867 Transcript_6420/m.15867 type:complete len:223 (-) Transcript_6420:848-1516(-)
MACVLPLLIMAENGEFSVATSDRKAIGSALVIVAQCAVNLWIWSVWTWRFGLDTGFRGRGAASLLNEFEAYGYSVDMMKLVGFVKLSCATLIAVAVMYPCAPLLLYVSSGGLLLLMLVAIVSHIKVADPWTRNIPAFCMAVLSLLTLLGSLEGCVTLAGEDGNTSSEGGLLDFVSSEYGRFGIGAVLLICDLVMWYSAKSSGKYATVPGSPENPFFALVEAK